MPDVVQGWVAPGFDEVRREFERNFADRRELGAAVAAYAGGEKVVDLWGGVRDGRSDAPWEEDTVVVVFSTSKGLAAMTLAVAHSRGWLDYGERVASYWPEFAQNGKGSITVRQLLNHEAGLPVIDERLTPSMLEDFDGLADVIARQRPLWKPGERHGYHGVSLGWYEGELIRRVDPKKRTLGSFFADEIAGPLGLDFWFGLPADVPKSRLARIERVNLLRALPQTRALPRGMQLAFLNPLSVTSRTFANPRMWSTADLDSRRFRHREFPAGGGIGNARSVARAYSALAMGGSELGIADVTMKELTRFPDPPRRGWFDEVLKTPTAFSLGFARPIDTFHFGSGPTALGHPGAGGSFAFADPERGVSFSYVMNRMGFHLNDDPREKPLREALYRCLDRQAVAA